MLFNSWAFLLLFLPAVLMVSRGLRGQWLLAWIAVSSYVFYAFAGHAWFLIPMIVTTCLDFLIAPRIEQARSAGTRRLLLGVSLCGNLGLLAYFKYSGLFSNTGSRLYHLIHPGHPTPVWFSAFDVILPAGISFYTFQTLSYIIDVFYSRCPAERNFFKFAGFVSFFPHLVAGPLTRHHQLIPSLSRIAETGITPRWQAGTYLFAIGLCKKVLIADRIGAMIDPLLIQTSGLKLQGAWVCALGYAVQIYFDFSGYSDMAIGLGRLFGIELPQNFNSPYQALNPSDFWRRWHMTLSQWLRDYLYFSLGGNRCSKLRSSANLMATMILGGLWHGASWTFAGWGALHGLYLVLYRLGGTWFDRLPAFLRRTVTFLCVCLAWIFFRATSFQQAFAWLAGALGRHGIEGVAEWNTMMGLTNPRFLLLGLVLALAIAFFLPNASGDDRLEWMGPARQFALGAVFAAALVCMNYSSRFLYFQF
jgi:alginate O-acetyltransferase complex protein AlgI